MIQPNPIYLVGASRSGTTWLQHLVGAHPRVATPQELDLFIDVVAPADRAFRQWLDDPPRWERQRYKGLPSVVPEDRFRELVAGLVSGIYADVRALKPGADVVLEKVPQYTTHAPLILKYAPEATFVHIIRDGRDVAASALRASRGWGRDWAPATVEDAASTWRADVLAGRRIAELTGRYVELRYEELASSNGDVVLRSVFDGCGLETSDAFCTETLAASRPSILWGGEVVARLGGEPREPEGFVGEARPGTWEKQFASYDRWLFDRAAGDLLIELGYVESRAWAGGSLRHRAGVRLHHARVEIARQSKRRRHHLRLAVKGR